MGPQRYIKKPIIIEAIQIDGTAENWKVVERFTEGQLYGEIGVGVIKTLEGEMQVTKDDWIIKGVNGEFYPCKPDIFEKTYAKAPS